MNLSEKKYSSYGELENEYLQGNIGWNEFQEKQLKMNDEFGDGLKIVNKIRRLEVYEFAKIIKSLNLDIREKTKIKK